MSKQLSTPQDWGLEQALQAPVWSDQTWLTVLAALGLRTTHIDVSYPIRSTHFTTNKVNT